MPRNTTRTIGTIVGILALVGGTSCSEVVNGFNTALCGTLAESKVTAVLTPASPNFYVATPATAKDGDANCETDFNLDWAWADTTRALAATTAPPLNNLSHAFQLDGGISYFSYTAVAARSGTQYWFVTTADHNAGGTGTTVYSISTSLASTTAADSIRVTGIIDYYH